MAYRCVVWCALSVNFEVVIERTVGHWCNLFRTAITYRAFDRIRAEPRHFSALVSVIIIIFNFYKEKKPNDAFKNFI